MPASDGLARRVVDAGRRCSLTTSVLEEWARRGTPRQVEYLAGYLEAERDIRNKMYFITRKGFCQQFFEIFLIF